MSASLVFRMTSSDASNILFTIYFNGWSSDSGFFTCGRKTWRDGGFIRRSMVSSGFGPQNASNSVDKGDFGFMVGTNEV